MLSSPTFLVRLLSRFRGRGVGPGLGVEDDGPATLRVCCPRWCGCVGVIRRRLRATMVWIREGEEGPDLAAGADLDVVSVDEVESPAPVSSRSRRRTSVLF